MTTYIGSGVICCFVI